MMTVWQLIGLFTWRETAPSMTSLLMFLTRVGDPPVDYAKFLDDNASSCINKANCKVLETEGHFLQACDVFSSISLNAFALYTNGQRLYYLPRRHSSS